MRGYPGERDILAAADELASELPDPLAPLARVAFNYRWSWSPIGPRVFAAIDPDRWARTGANPVRLLREARRSQLDRAASNASLIADVRSLAAEQAADEARAPVVEAGPASLDHPIAFFCAEFGVHHSLPIYSGGLGVLAGDILKESSDLMVPLVGIGLFYRTGYFHQRIDTRGSQHEYWLDTEPELLPCVRVGGTDGEPVVVAVPIGDDLVAAQIWRVDVGNVPLYLLDTDLPQNDAVGRWVTSRLYEGNRAIRLAQYAVLGVGGVRALRALGIDPARCHLNEGHAALVAAELVREGREGGLGTDEAWAATRDKLVFTTHTPVAAGNEQYGRDEIVAVLGPVADLVGDRERMLAMGRIDAADASAPFGMTPLAIRAARSTNGVSRRHGEVARQLWQPLFPGRAADDVPISHVTNGVHVPTWVGGPMLALLDRYLGTGWLARADDPAVWRHVDDIPDDELWAARRAARRALTEVLDRRVTSDRLRRGESLPYAAAGQRAFDPDTLTFGFARRLATYKRLHLLSMRPDRALALLDEGRTGHSHGTIQLVFAGKAHPQDEPAKEVLRGVFSLKSAPQIAGSVAFVEDYDLALAAELVRGCDVWVNLPRPSQEASGTSGMKACLNGALHLSVLDGWWAEAYDGSNGWAISGEIDPDTVAQDERHADQLFDLLERQVVPLFGERDDRGIPVRWLAMIRNSLKTNAHRFSATRMLREYLANAYR